MANFFHPNTPIDIDPDDTEPGCGFMSEMLTGLADGSAHGITKWYAERHVAGCPHCAAALSGLKRLRARLKTLSVVSSETLVVINQATFSASADRVSRMQAKLLAHDEGKNAQ